MDKTKSIFIVIWISIVLGAGTLLYTEDAEATGCPVDTIIPMIDDAISSMNSGDYAKALSQMQDMKNELEDTFEVDH